MDRVPLKEIFDMNNGSKPSNITLNAITMPYFSASAVKAGIIPVSRVTVGSLNTSLCNEIEISIIGVAEGNEFLHRADFVKECLNGDSYSLKKTDTVVFEFDSLCFTYDNAYLSGIDSETAGEIYIRVMIDGMEYLTKVSVTLLPSNVWPGLEAEPSSLCVYVSPDGENIASICKKLPDEQKADYTVSTKKSLMVTVRELYKLIKECNIIYTRPSGYSASSKQTVRTADELFGSGSILATPLEIALIFCSAAQRCGFDTSVLFVRTLEGDVNVLCGVYLVKSSMNIPVCENAEKIASLVDAGDMLILDPSVFAAAQNTSFSFVCETTAENFVNNPACLVCMIDVKCAMKSMKLIRENDDFSRLTVKQGAAMLYSSLSSRQVLQYLSGKRRPEFEEIPLLYPDFEAGFFDEGKKLLLPLETGVRLDDFAAIDKDFSSILTMFSPMARQHFSSGELLRMRQRFEKLKAKLSRSGTVTCALREEALYNAAQSMTFGKNKKEPYFAFGYVKITDKLTELISFAPVCLVKATITYDDGRFYVQQSGKPIVNKVFIRNALKDSALGYDSFMKSLMPEDKNEIFEMFENIRKALEETDDRHVYEIIREAHLVNIEIDDYILWSNLALERNKLSVSSAARCIFGEGEKQTARYNREYAPCKVLYEEGIKAVCTENDIIVTGAFTKEKEDILYAVCARSITEGKSLLVVTDDDEQSQYVKRILEQNGLSDCVLCTDSTTDGMVVSQRMVQSYDKYGFLDEKATLGFMPKELTQARRILDGYSEMTDKIHPLGMSLRGAVSAYLYSCKGLENVPEIPVDDSLLENADESRLEEIFEEAGETVALARRLCEKSGLKKYTPIERHPLYRSNPARIPTEGEMELVCQSTKELLPVLSGYRDVFSDVNEILGIDEREIDSLAKLEKINELYKLALSSAELEIPERFIESDIDLFVKNKRFAAETTKRMKEIENQLDFFGKEIFEDIESILKGEEYEETEKGFIKKIILKRNDKETLLQYVEPNGKNAFSQHKVSDIFALLYEYKACVVSLGEYRSEQPSDENALRLVTTAESAMDITEALSNCNDSLKKRRISNVFRLICVLPVDERLKAKMTAVSSALEEALNEKDGLLKVISNIMGIDFYSLRFGSGILSFDGFSKHLTEMCDKLDGISLWTKWLSRAERTSRILPQFVSYLEKHGALENIDRLFAKSLMYKVCDKIKKDILVGYSSENTGKAKDSYPELLSKAADISKANILTSYLNTVSHIKQVNTRQTIESYGAFNIREVLEKDFRSVTKMLPVIIVSKNDLTSLIPLDCVFDNVVCLDNRDNGYSMLPALGYGKRATIINMSRSALSDLCVTMSHKVQKVDVCAYTDNKDPFVFTWLNSVLFGEKCSVDKPFERTGIELVRMNGTFDRTTGRINKTEAELTLTKSSELCADKSKFVAVTAFTKEQCTLIEKMLHIVKKKNKVIREALEEGRLWVCTPDRLYMKNYNSLVVSACFGQDKDGRIGWDFGYAGKAYNEEIPEAYISIADKLTEKTYFLTSLNMKDSRLLRRTGNNAAIFNSFCEMLYDGHIPVSMRNSDSLEDESLITGAFVCIIRKTPRVLPCVGKLPVINAMSSVLSGGELFVLVDGENNVTMHDELLIKKSVSATGMSVTTLSPLALAGESVHKTVEELAKETLAERISG